jgi:hypothetical protein
MNEPENKKSLDVLSKIYFNASKMRQWHQKRKGELSTSIDSEVKGKFRKEKAIRLEKEKKEKSKLPAEESKHEAEKEKDEGMIDTTQASGEEAPEFNFEEEEEIRKLSD